VGGVGEEESAPHWKIAAFEVKVYLKEPELDGWKSLDERMVERVCALQQRYPHANHPHDSLFAPPLFVLFVFAPFSPQCQHLTRREAL
jgi:hypothetical protein